jgi:ATP-dependent protease HslVU (ClpYQ) peptidase subunit
MVGLCSEKKESMQDIVEYIWNKGIKMCVFTNNMAEVNSLKTLLK